MWDIFKTLLRNFLLNSVLQKLIFIFFDAILKMYQWYSPNDVVNQEIINVKLVNVSKEVKKVNKEKNNFVHN